MIHILIRFEKKKYQKQKQKQNKTKQHTLTHTRCNALQKFPINYVPILYCISLNNFTNNSVIS